MEKFNPPLSIRIIHILNEVIFWLFCVVCLLLIVFCILALAGLFDDGMQLHTRLPVAFNTSETGILKIDHNVSSVRLVEAYGSLHFIDTPGYISRSFLAPVMIVCSLMFFLLFTVRRFIHNVRRGVIFDKGNIKLLRSLSFGLLGFWIFWLFYDQLMSLIIGKNLMFGTIEVTTQVQSHAGLLLVSIVLWALSHIFNYGLKLQEESSLTI